MDLCVTPKVRKNRLFRRFWQGYRILILKWVSEIVQECEGLCGDISDYIYNYFLK